MISDKTLEPASQQQLENHVNEGIGVHWPDVDEDLILRGFLRDELAYMDTSLIA